MEWKSTVFGERAEWNESTVSNERAVVGESTKLEERATKRREHHTPRASRL